MNNMKRVTVYIDGFNFYYGLRTAKQVKAYFPPSIYSRDIANNIKAHKGKVTLLEKNYNKFVTAQMDETVTDGVKVYTKPEKWK